MNDFDKIVLHSLVNKDNSLRIERNDGMNMKIKCDSIIRRYRESQVEMFKVVREANEAAIVENDSNVKMIKSVISALENKEDKKFNVNYNAFLTKDSLTALAANSNDYIESIRELEKNIDDAKAMLEIAEDSYQAIDILKGYDIIGKDGGKINRG